MECENSAEGADNTPTNARGIDLPNLLGEYDCGDEPEEADDSVAGSDGESGESENMNDNDNDNDNDEVESPSPCIKQKDGLQKSESK
jgi:hypothetical protein